MLGFEQPSEKEKEKGESYEEERSGAVRCSGFHVNSLLISFGVLPKLAA